MFSRMDSSNAHSTPEIQYLPRTKPSTPIEIPSRQKTIVSSYLLSPVGRPTSPELVFEMSPISPNFSSPSHYLGFSASETSPQSERFMYSFPVYTGRPHERDDLCQRRLSVPTTGSDPTYTLRHTSPRDPLADCDCEQDDIPQSTEYHTCSTTKIAGFVPVFSTEPRISTATSPAQPLQHLSPPPRKCSYSTSPWLIPGRGPNQNYHAGDVMSAEADPTVLDFGCYLLQRMQNQKSSRVCVP